jgi:hypothetical protein
LTQIFTTTNERKFEFGKEYDKSEGRVLSDRSDDMTKGKGRLLSYD